MQPQGCPGLLQVIGPLHAPDFSSTLHCSVPVHRHCPPDTAPQLLSAKAGVTPTNNQSAIEQSGGRCMLMPFFLT
jgi:hypothetical protein